MQYYNKTKIKEHSGWKKEKSLTFEKITKSKGALFTLRKCQLFVYIYDTNISYLFTFNQNQLFVYFLSD